MKINNITVATGALRLAPSTTPSMKSDHLTRYTKAKIQVKIKIIAGTSTFKLHEPNALKVPNNLEKIGNPPTS